MERRINKLFDNYITTFKDNIRDKATTLGIQNEQTSNLLQYIYDYDRLVLAKEDFARGSELRTLFLTAIVVELSARMVSSVHEERRRVMSIVALT